MARTGLLLLAALLAGGCVSEDQPTNAAIRMLHAVPDAPRMNLYLNDQLRINGLDYRIGTAFLTFTAGTRDVRIDEILPAGSDPSALTIFDESLTLQVNDDVSIIVVGEAASNTEEVLQIPTRTRGVPTGKTRLQVVHAAVGGGPVDVYVIPPDAMVSASTPLAGDLAYKEWTGQDDIPGGNARIIITAANDPDEVLLESGTVFLTLEGTLLLAVLNNTGLDAMEHPYIISVLSGTSSSIVVDKDTPANLRVANVSPGDYEVDFFVNAGSVDNTARQTCDPLTMEPDTFLELCAIPYTAVGAYDVLTPGAYEFKIQQADAPDVQAKTLAASLVAGTQLTALITGLLPDPATSTTLNLLSLSSARRVYSTAQLRVVNASVAADAAISGDPTTDRLDFYITGPCPDLADETPDYTGVRFGSDTTYLQFLGGDYQLTLTRTDTADTEGSPEILLTNTVTLAEDGIYTLVMDDSVGGVQPMQFLSLDDDPSLADCPAPP